MAAVDDLLREFAEVQELAVLTDELEGVHRRREFLLRRAAVVDRLADVEPRNLSAADDADRCARELLAYDVEYQTSRGPLEAADRQWHSRLRAYVRQEYAAWSQEDSNLRPPHS